MTDRVYLPLRGIRVLSFEIAFALPAGTRVLSDLGAEVVRVARPGVNPVSRYIGVVDGVFHGKPAIDLDLTTAKGKDLARQLALQADVVTNNYRPGVLDKYGLGAKSLRSEKPAMIWLQLSGYGTPGPWSEFPAYGPSTEAAGGLNRLLVDEGEVPFRLGTGVFADQLSGRFAALAIIDALRHRHTTGNGKTIDLSMTECISHLLGSQLVQALRTGQVPAAERNRHPRFVPQGVYQTRGDDEWLAISIRTDDEWQRLAEITGMDSTAAAMTLEQRITHHDDIDTLLEKWTCEQDKNQAAEALQAAGIAAAPVRTVGDSALDPQFKARGSLQQVKHRKPAMGYRSHPHPPLPWLIKGRSRKTLTDYRNNGKDNASVLQRWLGLNAASVKALLQEQVLRSNSSNHMEDQLWSSQLVDPDFAKKLDLPQ